MRPDGIIIHYAEVATKGRNRPAFIKRLAANVGQALAGLPVDPVQRLSGRLWVPVTPDAELAASDLRERMATVYGVSSSSPVVCAPLDLDKMKQTALSLVCDRTYQTFRVSSRRVFKDQPLGSLEVDREVGAFLEERKPAKVKLKGADLQVFIEMLPERAYLYVDKHPGPGGLPVGITGNVTCLLSGGIDSPVAAARMQRRGCRVTFVHFHSHPYLSRASLEKATELAGHLARFQASAKLFCVPFGELQREIVTAVPPPLRVVLYRRFMLRLAGRIAIQQRSRALVTGESLGQVASQTLTNMVAIESAAPLPVLRPLVGFDKQEIIEQAKTLGTYETSILPDQDCCQLFVPRDPETHAKPDQVESAESRLDSEALCTDALERTEEQQLRAPWARDRRRETTPVRDDRSEGGVTARETDLL